jgi:hypothetical protein
MTAFAAAIRGGLVVTGSPEKSNDRQDRYARAIPQHASLHRRGSAFVATPRLMKPREIG